MPKKFTVITEVECVVVAETADEACAKVEKILTARLAKRTAVTISLIDVFTAFVLGTIAGLGLLFAVIIPVLHAFFYTTPVIHKFF